MEKHVNHLTLPLSQYANLERVCKLQPSSINLIVKMGQTKRISKKTHLFNAGDVADCFYLVLDGAIKLVKFSENENKVCKTVIEIIGPGQLIGLALMQSPNINQNYPVTGLPIDKAVVLEFKKEFYHSIWMQNTELFEFAQAQMIQRIQRIQNDRCMQRFTLEQKVAYLLTEKISNIKNIRITRQEIADAIGSSTESVIRLLNEWQNFNLINNNYREITILNFEELRKLWMDSK